MTNFKCTNCGKIFSQPDEKIITVSEMYGIKGQRDNEIILEVCPYCESAQIIKDYSENEQEYIDYNNYGGK